jgi:Amt family ammonium transporter
MISVIGGAAFWLIGYGLAFGHGNSFIGMSYFASYGLPEVEYIHWLFEFVHAATAATLVSGSMAERTNFIAYLVYSFVITGI